MTTKTYAILDPHAVGPAEEIQNGSGVQQPNGGLVATCNTDGSNGNRAIRGTEPMSSGQHYFEFAYYGPGVPTGLIAVGVMQASSSLSQAVGNEATSIGFRMADGNIYVNNSSVVSTNAAQIQQTCGVLLDVDAQTFTLYIGGSQAGQLTSIGAGPWYPGVTVGAINAYDLFVYFNFGAFAFEYPQGTLAWYTESGGFGSLRLCAQTGFQTAGSDTPPYTNYDPRILGFGTISFDRQAGVWVWNQQSSGTTYSVIPIDNHDGEFDYLLKADTRDAKVTVRMVQLGGTFADSFVVATTTINSVGSDTGSTEGAQLSDTSEAQLNLYLGDIMSTLQKQLQTRQFPPWVDSGIANRPYPILLGACRQVAPLLKDQENRVFQVGDASINNVGVLRDQGDPLDQNATPPDFTLSADGQSVITQVLPVGKLTGDFSSVGQQNVIPGPSDALGGAGTMTVWTSGASPADGWTAAGGGSFSRETHAGGFPQDYVAQFVATNAWSPTNGKFGYSWVLAAGLIPGRTYNFTFIPFRIVGTPPSVFGGAQFGLQLMSALTNNPADWISYYNQPIQAPLPPLVPGGPPGTYTFTYTVPAGASGNLYVVAVAAAGLTGGSASGACIADWYGITAELLANTITEVPLVPMTLYQFMQNIIEQRAGLTSSDWVAQDAIDIDTRTGYAGIGYYTSDSVTIEQALRTIADSYGAVILVDHLGRIRVRQLIDPDTVADGDVIITLDANQIAYPMACAVDNASGLTTVATAQTNYYISTDSDFVSDTTGGGIEYALRTRFKQPAQFYQVSTSPLASFYNFAKQVNVAPLSTNFDDPNDAQTEIDRINALFTTTPNFYTFICYYNSLTFETISHLIFGDTVIVDYDRYGLDGGKKCLVVEVNLLPGNLSVQLTVWRPST